MHVVRTCAPISDSQIRSFRVVYTSIHVRFRSAAQQRPRLAPKYTYCYIHVLIHMYAFVSILFYLDLVFSVGRSVGEMRVIVVSVMYYW